MQEQSEGVSGAPFEHRALLSEEAGGEEGWYSWNLADQSRYNNAVLGDLFVRREDNACRLRMRPERRHTNLGDNIHGGAMLGLIDIGLFATMHMLGDGKAGPSVTVELSTQFVGAGDPALPLDAITEIVCETGRLIFVRGQCVQVLQDGSEAVIASYSGVVRKMKPRR
ncbi:MAG: PaaI family thioesterase [Erythrobacter sp.]